MERSGVTEVELEWWEGKGRPVWWEGMGGQEDGQALLEGRLTLLLTAGHPHQLQILSMSKLVSCRIKIRELFANF